MESGEHCVINHLIKFMPTLFADNWATTVQVVLTISR